MTFYSDPFDGSDLASEREIERLELKVERLEQEVEDWKRQARDYEDRFAAAIQALKECEKNAAT